MAPLPQAAHGVTFRIVGSTLPDVQAKNTIGSRIDTSKSDGGSITPPFRQS